MFIIFVVSFICSGSILEYIEIGYRFIYCKTGNKKNEGKIRTGLK